jgi:transglutaminase/protease-like cytokinesis protein 3
LISNKQISILFIALLFLGKVVIAQPTNELDTKVVDHFNGKTVDKPALVKWLNENTKTDLEYSRAVFVFLSTQINYNMAAFEQGINLNVTPEAVLKTGNSVCQGYANLFKDLCDAKKIKCYVVTGHGEGLAARARAFDNHAWNCFQIEGKWYLAEATWAGFLYRQFGLSGIQGNTYNKFWMPNPANFVWEHLPNVPEFQLLNPVISIQAYKQGEKHVNELASNSITQPSIETVVFLNNTIDLEEHSKNLTLAASAYLYNPNNPMTYAFALLNNVVHQHESNRQTANKNNLDACIAFEKEVLKGYEKSLELMQAVRPRDEVIEKAIDTNEFNIKSTKKYIADLQKMKEFYEKQAR